MLTACVLGVVMGLGGVVGALAGAKLTHLLPLRELRLAFAVVLALAAARLMGWV